MPLLSFVLESCCIHTISAVLCEAKEHVTTMSIRLINLQGKFCILTGIWFCGPAIYMMHTEQ